MDNLTHSLVGAALGRAGLAGRTGLGMAALVIGANLPDLDVAAIPFGANLTFRRGWTHGPVAMLVLPVLLAASLAGWDRWQARRGRRPAGRAPVRAGWLLLLCFAGVLSHPALDWLNSYGVRLLMPFSGRWFYGDSIFIVDPWIWLALGAGVWLSRRRGAPAPRPARVALALCAAYVLLMVAGSRSAHAHGERHVAAREGRAPLRTMAGPVPLDPTRRELIVDMGGHYRTGTLAWRPGPVITLDPAPLPTGFADPAVEAALRHPRVQGFLVWSRFPYFTVAEGAGERVVRVGDARFRGRGGGWAGVEVRVAAE